MMFIFKFPGTPVFHKANLFAQSEFLLCRQVLPVLPAKAMQTKVKVKRTDSPIRKQALTLSNEE